MTRRDQSRRKTRANVRSRQAGICSSPVGTYLAVLPCEFRVATSVPFEHTAGWVGSALLLHRKCNPPVPGRTVQSIAFVAAEIAAGVGSPFRPRFAAANPATAMYIATPPMLLLSTLDAPNLSSTA